MTGPRPTRPKPNFSSVPPFVKDPRKGPLLIRGTPEWDEREHARLAAGFRVTSIGPIPEGGGLAR